MCDKERHHHHTRELECYGRTGCIHKPGRNSSLRLLKFDSHPFILTNTLHPHRLSLTTWYSPNGKIHNQIDFILVLQCYKSSINKANTRTFHGVYIGSDHDFVIVFSLNLKVKHCSKDSYICFDLEKLKDLEVAQLFQTKVGSKFAVLNLIISAVDTFADDVEEVLLTAAEEALDK